MGESIGDHRLTSAVAPPANADEKWHIGRAADGENALERVCYQARRKAVTDPSIGVRGAPGIPRLRREQAERCPRRPFRERRAQAAPGSDANGKSSCGRAAYPGVGQRSGR